MSVSIDASPFYREGATAGRNLTLAAAVRLHAMKLAEYPISIRQPFRIQATVSGMSVGWQASKPALGWPSRQLIGRDESRGWRLLPHAEGASPGVSVYEKELHELMIRSLQGDAAAYRRLLETLGGLFRAFFRRKLQAFDPTQAEDLVQETLLAIHLHRRSYDLKRPVTAWVYAIARYKLIDHLRRSPGARVFVPVDDVEDLVSEQTADAADPSRDITTLLDNLPAKQRTAIRLVKLEALTAKGASQKMGISESAVKISIHRGLKKLTTLVAQERIA